MALVVAVLAALVAGGAVFLALQALRGVQRAAATAAGLLAAVLGSAEARADAERVCAWAVSERETFEKIITRGVVGAAVRKRARRPSTTWRSCSGTRPPAWTAIRGVRIVPPSEQPEVYAGFDEESTAGPVERDRINEDGTIRLAPSADMHVELRSTDSRGRRWQRDDHGILSQVGETRGPRPGPRRAASTMAGRDGTAALVWSAELRARGRGDRRAPGAGHVQVGYEREGGDRRLLLAQQRCARGPCPGTSRGSAGAASTTPPPTKYASGSVKLAAIVNSRPRAIACCSKICSASGSPCSP